ncbi:MAG: hypothetical protein HC825_00380 [Oscillatoriales cyanobacterium RM1_1_9]|nr:hypothetical protein [Oscillatoriales cyanobacterium RM1_1_9]
MQSGQVLQIGSEVLIRLMFHCEPCKNLEKIHPGLMKRIGIQRGFLGFVIQGGEVFPEDIIRLTSDRFPALGDRAKERFWEFVPRIPAGKVVRTSNLLLALGVSSAYYRAIPTFLKTAIQSLPVHRIVAADGSLLPRYIPDQAQQLWAEGIELQRNKVVNSDDFWPPINFYPQILIHNNPN